MTVRPAELDRRLPAALAHTAGYRAAIAVVDLDSGARWEAGEATGEFGAASVVKVLVAARLLVEGPLDDATESLAWSMVTGSDDPAANVLWGRAGAEALQPWIARHYRIDGLGSPNGIPGRWGNTHLTARGLATLYRALRADPAVWPWLSRALHAVSPVAHDGTDQVFGLLAADPSAGVKQGWADGSADDARNAVVHSTGYVDDDRFAVVILTEGEGNVAGTDARGLHHGQADVVTAIARTLLG